MTLPPTFTTFIISIFNTIVEAYKAKLSVANERDELAVDLAVKESHQVPGAKYYQ